MFLAHHLPARQRFTVNAGEILVILHSLNGIGEFLHYAGAFLIQPDKIPELTNQSLLEFADDWTIPHVGHDEGRLALIEQRDFSFLLSASRFKGLDFKCDPSELLKIILIPADNLNNAGMVNLAPDCYRDSACGRFAILDFYNFHFDHPKKKSVR